MHLSALLLYEVAYGNHMIMRRLLVDRYTFSELALVVSNRLPYFLQYAALINLFTPQKGAYLGAAYIGNWTQQRIVLTTVLLFSVYIKITG